MTDTWQGMRDKALEARGDTWGDVCELHVAGEKVRGPEARTHPAMTKEFDGGFGHSEGPEFTLYTAGWVYFPAVYDGSEWAASVPRNPPTEPTPTEHVGGQ